MRRSAGRRRLCGGLLVAQGFHRLDRADEAETVPRHGADPVLTPAAIVDKLHQEIGAILGSPAMQKQLTNDGLDAMHMGPAEFGEYMETELVKWGRVVKEGGIKAE